MRACLDESLLSAFVCLNTRNVRPAAKRKSGKKAAAAAATTAGYPQVGIAAEQGRRPTMEDAECAITDLVRGA